MQLHHQKHHQTYITNYNKALEQLDAAVSKGDASTVVRLQGAIKFNGGGHVKHSIFWKNLAPVRYGALRWKIGGTYKDFFKSYVEVNGTYVEEGWVDKTCKVCKKDTRGEARQVDKFGKYVHVACLEKSTSGNFFTRLFSG